MIELLKSNKLLILSLASIVLSIIIFVGGLIITTMVWPLPIGPDGLSAHDAQGQMVMNIITYSSLIIGCLGGIGALVAILILMLRTAKK